MAEGKSSIDRTLSAVVLAVTLVLWLLANAQAGPLTSADMQRVFPASDAATTFAELPGPPAVTEVRRDGRLLGFVFSTDTVVGSIGYSGKPIDIAVGLSVDGTLTGAHLIAHQEPILVIGVPPEELSRFVAGFAGYNIRETVTSGRMPQAVSGASVSSAVIQDAIVRAARAVAAQQNLFGETKAARRIDRTSFTPATWEQLVNERSVARRTITHREVSDATSADPGNGVTSTDPDGTFIDLLVALATPPGIGQNLIGKRQFNRLIADAGLDDNFILVAANGRYSFKGTAYRKTGMFERVQLVQGTRTIRLTRQHYRNVEALAADGAPEHREIGLFILPHDTGFDPASPWRLDLFVSQKTQDGGALSAVFSLPYALPERFIISPETLAAPTAAQASLALWQDIWLQRSGEIAVLAVILLVLTAMLVFQDVVVRNDRVYKTLRFGFLAITVLWIGLIAGAQLSVVNVITFSQSLLTGFSWDLFLLDPLVFMLWGFTAVALLFWGRGVFCGWLCPFGALQELLNEGARKLGIPQIKVPFKLHERLWPIKYVIFLALFAVSLGSVELAFRGAEVEPFKTVVSMKFVREWPFVLFALALLITGLFIERFYCRYLCPLGAALAIPARLHMFQWLKRRHQCGRECKVCEVHCTVQAIHPGGEINPNECIHCLNCQRLYNDKTMCPPLIVREKRRLKRAAVAAKASEEATQE